VLPVTTRSRHLVLTSELYRNVLAGDESFLIRPIMNIHGELRPVPTRARAQNGIGGLLWAFFPRGINTDAYQLRSCPYGDPNDSLLITTPDPKDMPLTATVLESYPHRVLATTDKFLQSLAPSYWARLGGVQDFYEHWQRSFGRSFKLTQEPWAWVIRIEPPAQSPAVVESEPEIKPGLFGRWRHRRRKQQAQKTTAVFPPGTGTTTPADTAKAHRHLIAAQMNALACLENAIKARREGRAEEAWRMLNVAHRILDRATKK
jgi:hypothetical protein